MDVLWTRIYTDLHGFKLPLEPTTDHQLPTTACPIINNQSKGGRATNLTAEDAEDAEGGGRRTVGRGRWTVGVGRGGRRDTSDQIRDTNSTADERRWTPIQSSIINSQ
jgi:hypothetical protein